MNRKSISLWHSLPLSIIAVMGLSTWQNRREMRRKAKGKPLPTEAERREIFDEGARGWDAMVFWDELSMSLTSWRFEVIRRAYGHVLEVAVGTGRNFQFYDHTKVKSIVAVDFSEGMLDVAASKRKYIHQAIPVQFEVADILHLDFPDDTFDTVVDTFGICSFEKPVESVNEMARVLKPKGSVLLLEHGCGTWNWMNMRLDKLLAEHVHKYACYHNRPIDQIVRQAGLEVIRCERRHSGTSYFIYATKTCHGKPPTRMETEEKTDETSSQPTATDDHQAGQARQSTSDSAPAQSETPQKTARHAEDT
mmetsp:Transcript_48048/g.120307  ORF Transcript_48048/g.120307 Transcript_48048/m.120307 type:complete len:307 (-) Transcript_48048:254-1174(-)